MSLIERRWFRRLVLILLAGSGATLLLAGIATDRPVFSATGLGAWLLMAVGFMLAARQRLSALIYAVDLTRRELGVVRGSQLKMHSKLGVIEIARAREARELRESVTVLRRSQLKMHTRVAALRKAFRDDQQQQLERHQKILDRHQGLESLNAASRSAVLQLQSDVHDVGRQMEKLVATYSLDTGGAKRGIQLLADLVRSAVSDVAANHAVLETITGIVDGLRGELDSVQRNLVRYAEQQATADDLEVLQTMAQHLSELAAQAPDASHTWRQVQEELSLLREVLGARNEELMRVRQDLAEGRGELVSTSKELELGRKELELGRKELEIGRREVKEGMQALTGVSTTLSGLADPKKAADLSHETLGWLKHELVQEVEALDQLRGLFKPSQITLPLGRGAMDPVAMLAVVQEVLERKPELVVECGSGASTVWLGYALRLAGKGRLVSLEHSDKYFQLVRQQLELHGLAEVVDLRLAPLEGQKVGKADYPWYAPDGWLDLQNVELLLVDGPPGPVGPLARYPALPLLGEKLAKGAVVVLDDTDRGDEITTKKKWKSQFPIISHRTMGPRTQALLYEGGANNE